MKLTLTLVDVREGDSEALGADLGKRLVIMPFTDVMLALGMFLPPLAERQIQAHLEENALQLVISNEDGALGAVTGSHDVEQYAAVLNVTASAAEYALNAGHGSITTIEAVEERAGHAWEAMRRTIFPSTISWEDVSAQSKLAWKAVLRVACPDWPQDR